MALTPEQIQRMDSITGSGAGLTPEKIAAMDEITGGGQSNGQDAGALAAAGEGLANAVPFGQRITSAIGAVGTAALSPDVGFKDIPELYNQAQQNTEATAAAHPVAAGAGTVAGIIPTLALGGGAAKFAAKPIINGSGMAVKAANLAGRAVKGAAIAAPVGAVYGAGAAPTIEDMPAAAKSGAGLAAAIGAGAPLVGAAGGAALSAMAPKLNEGLVEVGQLAQKYKIPVSINQISSSRAVKNIQKVSQELPFSGQEGFQDKQMTAFNRALLNTVGEKGDHITPLAIDRAFSKVGMEFDALGRGKTFQLGDDFARSLDAIKSDAEITASSDALSNFDKMAQRVFKEAGSKGEISGEKLGKLRSDINRLARKSNNPDTQELLHDLENSVVDLMTAGDDAARGEFSATKQKYKNLIAIEPLIAKGRAGNISPSLLNARVAKIYGRSHTRGQAGEIGDLARIGHELLPELGGSDTAQKLMYAGGAMGGVAAAPVTTAVTLAGNRAMQGLNRNQSLVQKMMEKAKADFELKRGKK